MSSETKGMESQVRFCQERVGLVQKHFGHFCQTLGSMTRKMAKMRDKGDTLAKQMSAFADSDKISHSTCVNLRKFAENLSAIQDYRDAEIKRLDKKVLQPLCAYGKKCKTVKTCIKTEQNAITKEVKQKTKLEKTRNQHPGDAHLLAETAAQKAAADANIGNQALCSQLQTFEREKVQDLKRILMDFVSVEMVFHAKALEYYSHCFENLAMIDEEMDVEEFSRRLTLSRGATFQAGLEMGGQSGQGTLSTMGTTATGSGMTTTYGSGSEYTSTGSYTMGSTMSGTEKRVRIQAQSMYDDDDDEDEDDDEDDDDSIPARRR